MADEKERETAKAAQEARDRAGAAAYEAARFDGLCEEGAAEVAAAALRALHGDAENASQTGNE
jgi:hypothetical protein